MYFETTEFIRRNYAIELCPVELGRYVGQKIDDGRLLIRAKPETMDFTLSAPLRDRLWREATAGYTKHRLALAAKLAPHWSLKAARGAAPIRLYLQLDQVSPAMSARSWRR